MNEKLRAFIVATIIAVFSFTISIITFSQNCWYGVIPLALGLFFLLRYSIPAWRQYQEETAPAKKKNTNHALLKDYARRVEFCREMLVSYYIDLGDDFFFDLDEQGFDVYSSFAKHKENISDKVRLYIKKQEFQCGNSFLLSKEDTEEDIAIRKNIGEYAFCVSIYYAFEFDIGYPSNSIDEIVDILIKIFDEDEKNKIFDSCIDDMSVFILLSEKIDNLLQTKKDGE